MEILWRKPAAGSAWCQGLVFDGKSLQLITIFSKAIGIPMSLTRRLIIHADDLGLSPAVNRGILHAMAEGVVTSTSLLCNFPQSREALRAALEAGRDVGWHLNLVQGRPLTDPTRIPSLVGKDGRFLSLRCLLFRAWTRRLVLSEIKMELEAQYRLFTAAGTRPSHVDGHLHAHLLPQVREVLKDFITQRQIPFVRVPSESGGMRAPRWPARTFLKYFMAPPREFWRNTGANSLPFLGLALSGRPGDPKLWKKELERNPHPLAECMVHPGYFEAGEAPELGEMQKGREAELAWLTGPDLRNLLRDLKYQLVSFKDLETPN